MNFAEKTSEAGKFSYLIMLPILTQILVRLQDLIDSFEIRFTKFDPS